MDDKTTGRKQVVVAKCTVRISSKQRGGFPVSITLKSRRVCFCVVSFFSKEQRVERVPPCAFSCRCIAATVVAVVVVWFTSQLSVSEKDRRCQHPHEVDRNQTTMKRPWSDHGPRTTPRVPTPPPPPPTVLVSSLKRLSSPAVVTLSE